MAFNRIAGEDTYATLRAFPGSMMLTGAMDTRATSEPAGLFRHDKAFSVIHISFVTGRRNNRTKVHMRTQFPACRDIPGTLDILIHQRIVVLEVGTNTFLSQGTGDAAITGAYSRNGCLVLANATGIRLARKLLPDPLRPR